MGAFYDGEDNPCRYAAALAGHVCTRRDGRRCGQTECHLEHHAQSVEQARMRRQVTEILGYDPYLVGGSDVG